MNNHASFSLYHGKIITFATAKKNAKKTITI